MKIQFALLVLLITVGYSCRKDPQDHFVFKTPRHFPEPHFQFQNFELTQARIDLGKTLFYDPILSLDETVSCASCHHKAAGFSDPGKPFSVGVDDSISLRNSIALANLAWNTSFFFDGGVNHLELSSFAPLTNEKEMHENINHVIEKINQKNQYRSLVASAFQSDTINAQFLLRSLAAYMATLISAESEYDNVYKSESQYNEKEQLGYNLFKRDCIQCHSEPLTTNFNFENNGLDSLLIDIGRERITQDPNDRGKFKVPSLRNVALSSPYMHDGRFVTLEEVIDHYSEGIKISATVNSSLIGGFNYTPLEKEAIVLFLKSLTDYNFINNPNF